ncbi:MAG: acylneuraminate cytidylyltransferase family protein [Elusimicrobia bacterium]|nr:acylneuraminate cytidylyltransferase family protein [Elusimicrobiota bacterium]
MYKNWKILALITARGGSKGVPKKNIRPLGGVPLIAHSIVTARQCCYVDRTIVSTDDPEIQKVAESYQAEIPFLRPAELADDLVPDYPVIQHCLDWLREHEAYQPDIIVHLRPTGPLRKARDVEKGVELLGANPDADSVRSVNEPRTSPYKMWTIQEKFMRPLLTLEGHPDAHHGPRQALPKVYQTNPYVGVMWSKTVTQKKSIIGDKVLPMIMEEPIVDIDTEFDFAVAELLLKNKNDQ